MRSENKNFVLAETQKWALTKNVRYDSYEACYKPKLKTRKAIIAGKQLIFEETPLNLYDASFGSYAFSYSSARQFKNSFFAKNRKRFEEMSSKEDIDEFERACEKI